MPSDPTAADIEKQLARFEGKPNTPATRADVVRAIQTLAERPSSDAAREAAEARAAFLAGWWVNAAEVEGGPSGREYFDRCAENDWQEYRAAPTPPVAADAEVERLTRERDAAVKRAYLAERLVEARAKTPDWEPLWAEQSERAEAAEAERDTLAATVERMREPFMGVLASLVAAVSILRRAEEMGVRPSQAVASDAMFAQMLADYDQAIARGRAERPAPGGWRSMDSAPKDGTRIDLWVTPHDAFENGNPGRVPNAWFGDEEWWRSIHAPSPVSQCGVPTHWRPLPPPPATDGEP